MDEITREEFMTSINDWDSTKYDNPEGESERLIKQFSPIPADITNSYYNDQGDIRVTKGDAVVDPKIKDDPSDSNNDSVVNDADIDLIFSPGHMADVDRSLKDPADSDSKKELDSNVIEPETVVETVVDDSKLESTPDLVVIESKTGPVGGNNVQYKSKPNGQASRSKSKTKKKKGEQRH